MYFRWVYVVHRIVGPLFFIAAPPEKAVKGRVSN